MTERQRAEALAIRRTEGLPWHSPPHQVTAGGFYHLSAACYEHAPIVGASPQRMACFESRLLDALAGARNRVCAWCVLPNHYHVLMRTRDLEATVSALGRLHGSTSFQWNGEEGRRGRRVWHRCGDRAVRCGDHYWASLNYIHHNPVHHGYAGAWEEWPFSSARAFLAHLGRDEAARIWRTYPLLNYGQGWDDAHV
jgi:putative transposase